jgi:hypothetical protein
MDKADPFSTLLMANIGMLSQKNPASLFHSKQMVRSAGARKIRCSARSRLTLLENIDQEQRLT